MASEYSITFNYNKAVKQAGELEEIAQEIRKVANDKMETSIQTVDKNWDGATSKKFVTKSKQLKSKVVDSADDIEKIASTIKTMAKAIYDAEMEALRIAQERDS